MGSSTDKAKDWGAIINYWGKIIGGAFAIIGSATFAYLKIYENERNIELLRLEDERRITLLIQRSDKRYKRSKDLVDELKVFHRMDEDRIIELEKDNYFLKGYIKGRKE